MLSYTLPQIYTSHSDHGLLCRTSCKMSFQCLLCTVYAAKKSLDDVYWWKFRSSAKIGRKNNWCSLDLYANVLNAFLTRKGSAILHGDKFVFLTEWFMVMSSPDITNMSISFLDVGTSENVTF